MKFKYLGISSLLCLSLMNAQIDIEDISTSVSTDNTNGKTFFAHRSQGDNLVRRIVGEEFLLVENSDCGWLSVGSVALEYTRSFDRNDLGTYFSFNKSPKMLFAGDDAPADIVALRDVRAEYFGLASDFVGIVEFRPQVENVIADVNLHFNLDNLLCGLYFDIGIPIVWTRFGMNLEQEIENAGTFIDLGLGVNNPPPFSKSIIQAYKGKNGGIPIAGIIVENLNFARINGRQTKTNVANFKCILGYNFWSNEYGHFGVDFRIAAPTGTRPAGEFVFEPIVGNGKHVEIGAGLSGHYVLWESGCDDESFSFWLQAEVQHLTKAKQKRTFDFTNNGVGSRYIYLKKFNADNTFEGTVIPAANITTLDADVRVAAAGEAIFMFDYQRCGFLFDVGYGIWGRSKEKITLKNDRIPENLGIAGKIDAPSLDRTKSNATISTDGSVDGTSSADNVYITLNDIDVESAASPSAISHKIFAHLNYSWDICDYSPFVGIGGEAEFSGRKNHALSQWGIWIKGGVVFNL